VLWTVHNVEKDGAKVENSGRVMESTSGHEIAKNFPCPTRILAVL